MPSIQGRVLEVYTRRPVQGAVIVVGNLSTVTDSQGRFSMTVPVGTISLQVSHPEFHPYITSLNLPREMPYNVGTINLQSRIVALR